MSFIDRPAMLALSGSPDRFGLRHATASQTARDAFAAATEALALHRPELGPSLARALEAAPDMVAAHALRGFANVMLARPETIALGRAASSEARAVARAATADETALLDALAEAVDGRLTDAADTLDRRLADNPTALLLVKLSHALRFMAGDVAGMRRTIGLVRPAWNDHVAGYGFFLGCHAFTLEESGEFAGAIRLGRLAALIEPRDAWALHAVAHAHEMRHEVAAGIDWIERNRAGWSGAGNFAFHLAWHLALFHLDRGDHARVLDLYDREIRPAGAAPSEEFRDVANAVSILWRLRQHGVQVGGRWRELADIARRRRGETALLFATLHHLLALLATGDRAAAGELRAAIARRAETCPVARDAALPLADALIAGVAFGAELRRLQLLGGSHAQRDVFVRSLALAARAAGNAGALAGILAARRRLKQDDAFVALLETA